MSAALGVRRRSLAWLAPVAAVIVIASVPATSHPRAGCAGVDAPIAGAGGVAEDALLCAINAYRAERGKSPLERDGRLAEAARSHSDHMAAVGRLEHVGIGNGTPESRARDAGYRHLVAENIVEGGPSTTPADVLELWKDSRLHDANLLGRHEDAGIGFSDAAGGPYGTLLLGAGSTAKRCAAAKAKVAAWEAAVRRARRDVHASDSAEARKVLRRAKNRLASAKAAKRRACRG
jgi:uncharacterized protein YkwD